MSAANKETTGIINIFTLILFTLSKTMFLFLKTTNKRNGGLLSTNLYKIYLCCYMHSFSIENFTLNSGGSGRKVNFVTLSLSNEMEIIAAAYIESVI